MQTILLSHIVGAGGPVYPGDPTASVEQLANMAAGDPCNTYYLHMLNHFGSHVDGPRHFNPNGPYLADLPVERFIFHSVGLIELPKGDDELVSAEELREALPKGWLCDLLLIRTGFGKFHESDPHRYAHHSPGLSVEAARLIVDELASVCAIGLDTISAGAPAHPAEGHHTHRLLCGHGRKDGRFVLIYEDLNLAPLRNPPLRVWGLPLLIEGVDSAPVTMVAET
jgi:arylformamidase